MRRQFHARLRELRTARGMSQADLARRSFVGKSYLSELENDVKTPSLAMARALDAALDAGGELAELVPTHRRPAGLAAAGRRSSPLAGGTAPARRAIVDPSFPARLRELREARGMSLRDLSAATYVSKSALSQLENGHYSPSAETAACLDRALEAGGGLTGMVHEAPAPAPPRARIADRLAHAIAGYLLDGGLADAIAEQVAERLRADRADTPSGGRP